MLERFIELGSVPLLMLALLVAGLGVPIPEDVVLLAGGVVAHRTSAGWWVVLGAMYAGVLGADCILYFVARRFGEDLLRRAPLRWLATPQRRVHVRRLFEQYGARAVFVGRHLGGLRAIVFVLAAIEGVRFRVFLLWDAVGALVTVPFVFGLGYLFSAHVSAVEAGIARVEHWALAGAGAVALIVWVWYERRSGHR